MEGSAAAAAGDASPRSGEVTMKFPPRTGPPFAPKAELREIIMRLQSAAAVEPYTPIKDLTKTKDMGQCLHDLKLAGDAAEAPELREKLKLVEQLRNQETETHKKELATLRSRLQLQEQQSAQQARQIAALSAELAKAYADWAADVEGLHEKYLARIAALELGDTARAVDGADPTYIKKT
eukprot:TRINITY_DN65159_c0_g1_i1.p1 TRINITY_DN65159_c0_g1~~TRINITY_DN65159_c0_g1_i1.p1  ORF type:complete len:180 (+),score=60.85 TRINITY_DN65159_c0_g1_i1:94-633(+)